MIVVIIQSLWFKVLYIFILSEREINRKSLFWNAFDMVDVGKRIQSLSFFLKVDHVHMRPFADIRSAQSSRTVE